MFLKIMKKLVLEFQEFMIYDVCKRRFGHGSWIFSPTAPLGVSILGDI